MPPKKNTSLTWEDGLDRYETHLRARRASARTVSEKLLDLGHLVAYLELRAPRTEPGQVTVQDLREYQVGLFTGRTSSSRKHLAARTVAKNSSNIRCFFAWLVDEELIIANPAARLEQPRTPKRNVGDVLTVPEAARLLSAAARDVSPCGLRDRAALDLLYATGVRRNELLALDLQDLDRDERELIVRHGKGDKPRRLPITRSAFAAVTSYLDDGRPGLESRHEDSARAVLLSNRGRRLDHMTLLRILRRLRTAARIRRRVTPHCCRRSFATHLLQGGASLRHIQLLLGHAELSTTAFYLKLDTRELHRELLLKHPRERIDA
jgi:site-specific recombinase XerD